MTNIIQTNHLSKEFESGGQITYALRDVSISIASGELTLIVGPSGCGKTTLLSIITGILTPTAGNVIVNNVDITNLSGNEKTLFRRKNIGFIFQQFNLLPTLSTIENICIPLIAAKVAFNVAEKKAYDILAQLGMEKNATKLPQQLSGGEQQRVAIARALVHDPSIIVCDEPTSSLDLHTGEKIMEILKEKAMQLNKSVIVVTHDPRILKYGDRTIKMNDGAIE